MRGFHIGDAVATAQGHIYGDSYYRGVAVQAPDYVIHYIITCLTAKYLEY